jgi:hypothetical protein
VSYFVASGSSWLILELPVKTVSEANVSCHRMVRAKRAREQRRMSRGWLGVCGRPLPQLPVTIIIDRFGPKRLDKDNLQRALKACRDGAADAYGIDDADPLITWKYGQNATGPGDYSVQFTIIGGGTNA